jgi:PatG Domain
MDELQIAQENKPAGAQAKSSQPCPSCGSNNAGARVQPHPTASTAYIYAIGRIELRFPSPSVEKEFAQVTGRAETAGLTDRQAAQKVLSQRSNRYLARQMCWILSVEGLESYILLPRDPADFDLLIDALRPTPSPLDLDVVIGVKGPVASPDMCNGLMVPVLFFDQLYSFDRDSLIKGIPRPEQMHPDAFTAAAEELFDQVMQMADNVGATDKHRALNYLAVRYPAIYAKAAERFAANSSLTGLSVNSSSLSGGRKILDVIFSFTDRANDVTDKFRCRVDVNEEFPFLVTKLSPYYDR